MQPEISQYLSGIRKTIEQVLMTHLTDNFAQEQAGMVMGTLGFVQLIQDKAFHYELLENHLYKRLLADAAAVVSEDAATGEATAVVLAGIRNHLNTDPVDDAAHLRPYRFLRSSNETMREHLSALIRCQDTFPATIAARFQELLQPFLRDLHVRERSWVKALGFDCLDDTVPDIDTLLYRDGRLCVPGLA